jgi:hypothetical protein
MTVTPIPTPTKNWHLRCVIDLPPTDRRSTCEFCGARIRHEYHLYQDISGAMETLIVGSECVKSLTDSCDPHVAHRLLHDEWKQRRGYFYKRVFGITCIIGQKDDRWYTALAPSVRSRWEFGPSFRSAEDAKLYFAQIALGGLQRKAEKMRSAVADAETAETGARG